MREGEERRVIETDTNDNEMESGVKDINRIGDDPICYCHINSPVTGQ